MEEIKNSFGKVTKRKYSLKELVFLGLLAKSANGKHDHYGKSTELSETKKRKNAAKKAYLESLGEKNEIM